jgi:hypothetical protein
MAYFRNLPNILYPSLRKGKVSSHDYALIKNLFKRAKIPDEILNIYTAFDNYQIVGDDRPDNVAYKYYDNSEYDWIILITNNIQNLRSDWPLSQNDLNNYLLDKYTETELSEIKYYETNELKNSKGHVILKSGIKVTSNYIFKYTDGGQIITKNPTKSVSNYQYEIELNEKKRNILMLRPEYIAIVEKELRNIFMYKPSSLFIDEFTIKVEDQCIPPL